MLQFQELTAEHGAHLRPYYERCDYRLCEYSLGVKLMWRGHLHPAFDEAAGCLIIRNVIDGDTVFDYPIPGPEGDTDAALTAIEGYCAAKGLPLSLSVVPEDKLPGLCLRYPRFRVTNERGWKDYLYHTEELASFAGRRYSGQRNHINKFRRDYPDAAFIPLTDPDDPRLAAFWADYEAEFHKTGPLAVKELELAKEMFSLLRTGWFCAGGILAEGRLVAVCLAERCGPTLVDHIEKALYSHAGAYPALVQSFAAYYGQDCLWCNREDDARDKGLRMSKLQYLPQELGGKVRIDVGTELDSLARIPTIKSERLSLTPLRPSDREAYNALCLDDDRNRWWGYDYRADLGDAPLTDDYFLSVAKADFAARRAVNFAVRLKGKLIGEVVLYNPDFRGGFEQGCRIAPAYAGHGYGTEAFAAAAEWALYHLGLTRVVAKCFKENEASHRMLSASMRPSGEDETYFYFEKTV
mgnify:FL=1